MRYLKSAFVFSIRQQPKQGAAVQHIAELISAQIMLQSLKPHLNLVLSYGSLLCLALLLPVPHGDILVLSYPANFLCSAGIHYQYQKAN